MPSQVHFFATRNDVVPVLETIESEREIQYVKHGRSDSEKPDSFLKVAALPNLGIASNESAINCTSYLICLRSEVIQARPAAGRYLIDQLINPNTVTFSAGGLWGGDILLYGRFASASASEFSLDMMKLLKSATRKRFEKIRAFYVGEEAKKMLDSGKRLTIAAQSPRSLDLSR